MYVCTAVLIRISHYVPNENENENENNANVLTERTRRCESCYGVKCGTYAHVYVTSTKLYAF